MATRQHHASGIEIVLNDSVSGNPASGEHPRDKTRLAARLNEHDPAPSECQRNQLLVIVWCVVKFPQLQVDRYRMVAHLEEKRLP
jgi:hypothetical protein